MHFSDIFKTGFKDQVDLFNTFLNYEQFFGQSNYKTLYLLWAPDPDQIQGKILKNYATSDLCIPLILFFQSSFYKCSIPNDCKLRMLYQYTQKAKKLST